MQPEFYNATVDEGQGSGNPQMQLVCRTYLAFWQERRIILIINVVVRRPRVKGRFVKQMETDGPLDMIDEHCQALPAPDTDMEHASDAECSGDDEGPLNLKVHGERHASHVDNHLI